MDRNTPEPPVIALPLSTIENMMMEIEWRITHMEEMNQEFLKLLKEIKEKYDLK
jgi:hypothetical protein